MKRNKIKKTFLLQRDQADCGIACLASIINYYEGYVSFDKLRHLSGTNKTGTTLLGLFQCASEIGFDASGVQIEWNSIDDLKTPCILHVIKNQLSHFVVFYGVWYSKKNQKLLLIGDPLIGLQELNEDDLKLIWISKYALLLSPDEHFEKVKKISKNKRKLFLSLLNEDLPILAVTLFLGIVITILNMSTAIFLQKIIDDFLPKGHMSRLNIIFCLLALVQICRVSLSYIRQHFALMQSKDFNERIGGSFFRAILFLPKSYFDTRSTGDFTSRLNDVMRIQQNISYIFGLIIIDLLTCIVVCAVILAYSVPLSIITVAFMPILALISWKYSGPLKARQREAMASYAQNESYYINSIEGIEAIKSTNSEPHFANLNKLIYKFFQEQILRLGNTANKYSFVSESFFVAYSTIILWVASYLVFSHQLLIGEMIAIITLIGIIVPSITRLSQVNLHVQEAKIAFDRMYEFTGAESEHTDAPLDEIELTQLEIQGLSFRYPGRKQVLKNIDIKVSKGELIYLVGESGGGKSTILQLLQKYYVPITGSIFVNGDDLKFVQTNSWRHIIAIVPQKIILFNGSILWNISLSDSADDLHTAYQLCIACGLEAYFKKFPQGLETLITDGGSNISGGQKQLIAFLRAIYQKPKLLLLDEFNSSMDQLLQDKVTEILASLKHTMCTIIVTHNYYKINFSDKIYVFNNGSIEDSGTARELLMRDNFFSKAISNVNQS